MNKKAWKVTIVAVLGGISLAFLQNKVSPIIPILMEEFTINMNVAGLLSSIFSLIGIIIAIPSAMILKNLGPKKSGILSLVVSSIGSILGLATNNITILIISRVIEGAGVGIIAVLVPSLISMWFPPEKRGLPMGIWGAWMTISSSMTFLISGPITNKFGWKGLWWFGLIMCVVSLVLFILYVESPPKEESFADSEEDTISVKEGIKSKSMWLLGLSALLFAFCSFSFGNWVTPFWMEGSGWSLETTQKWIALLYFVEIFFATLVGYILDRIKGRINFGALGFIFYGIVGLIVFKISSPIWMIALVFIFPIFDSLVPSVFWTVGPQTAMEPKYTGIALAVLNIGLNTGTLLSGPVSGWLVDSFGWNSLAIMFLILSLVGALLLKKVKLNF